MADRLTLLTDPPADTFIADNLKSVRDKLAQVPEGKSGAVVFAIDWKFGIVPTFKTGLAHRTASGWEIAGEGFLSKADKGVRVGVVKAW